MMHLRTTRRDGAIASLAAVTALAVLTLAPPGPFAQPTTPSVVRNAGFEEPGGGVPPGWNWDTERTGGNGTVAVDRSRAHEGTASLRLQPNARNQADRPLAVSQNVRVGALRGQRVEIRGHVAAEGDARAVVAVLTVQGGRPGNLKMAPQVQNQGWTPVSLAYDLPDDESAMVAVICWVEGRGGSAWFDGLEIGAPGSAGATAPTTAVAGRASGESLQATIEVDAGRELRAIPGEMFGTNVEWRWNATNLWQESANRLDPDLVRLTRDLGVTLVRYPGGIYSDTYHWRDGIGPREKRPVLQHEPDKDEKSRPNFGTEEALDFARQAGAELLITVNAGTGTAQEAADWVKYVNAKSLQVRNWEIGNELYIKGGPGSKKPTLDPETYAKRVREFAQAMRAADPRIRIGAIGGENYGRYTIMSYPNWNRIVLERAGDMIDFLAIHNAYAPLVSAQEERRDPRAIYRAMLAAPQLIAANLRTVAKQIDDYTPRGARRPFIAVTEWGPAFSWEHKSRYVDHPKTLGSALFAASTMKAFLESPHTQLACFWMLHDWSVLGWIGSRNGDFPPRPEWIPTARYYALQMFTRHFGTRLVASRTRSPTFDSEAIGLVDAVKGVPYLETVASLSPDGRQLFVIVINKHFDESIEVDLAITGFRPAPSGQARTLTGAGIDANTGTQVVRVPGLVWGDQVEDPLSRRFRRGAADEVTLASRPFTAGERVKHVFPPRSVTSLVMTRQ